MKTLYERLEAYGKSDYYGFHMPGHKRNPVFGKEMLPYQIDITEIEGFDDLNHAEGILKDAQARASRLYQSGETHFLINGSTVGILSAVLGCTKRGDQILMARNCHKSVYHAVYLQELSPVYIYPEYLQEEQINGEIDAGEIEHILDRNPEIRAVILVSPTYDGVLSDIGRIADIVHRRKIPLIVDEAHGAHFGFGEAFPKNSNVLGADIVIHSLHKTLPSMTQTALLHMNGTIVNRERVRRYLHMLQSSSPSYVLMASMDTCMELLEKEGAQLFREYADRLQRFRRETAGLKRLKLVQTEHFDPSKLILSTAGTGWSGKEVAKILLERYHLQMEMQADHYVLAMTSICDTEEGFDRLKSALHDIDSLMEDKVNTDSCSRIQRLPRPEQIYNSSCTERKAEESGTEILSWKESIGKVSVEYAYLYPPGIPFLVPGERIDQSIIECLLYYKMMGFAIEGLKETDCIEVLKERGK